MIIKAIAVAFGILLSDAIKFFARKFKKRCKSEMIICCIAVSIAVDYTKKIMLVRRNQHKKRK